MSAERRIALIVEPSRCRGELPAWAAAWHEDGVRPEAGMQDAIEAVAPESVRRNVAARLGRHSHAILRFAQAAAVLGEAGLAQTATLAAVGPEQARAAANALVRSGILRDGAVIIYSVSVGTRPRRAAFSGVGAPTASEHRSRCSRRPDRRTGPLPGSRR